ncbi:DNA adenine methylase [Daejeonella rubra]|uniref:Site-specific DNA-methyltransferase (adenine-specific) n=1 Tax=Daejeonella rubra TaxID=990371 RepID=A0A1G9X3C3_9SPHI|nr:Dam family site-specific DNA-(adenine-N6)-methyltransferase [Daejeonella rubra]SDM91197.1 DNA adenine methylase [Daejeonella rubra]
MIESLNRVNNLATEECVTKLRVKPFIRWAGGKQNLVAKLSLHLPKFKFNRYFEPFLGAGSMFLYNGFTNTVLSDINSHLVNAYKQLASSPEEIFDQLQYHLRLLNPDYYYKLRTIFNQNRDSFNIDQASLFIFLVHTSFNGIYRVNKKGEYNVPVGKLNPSLPSIEHLKAIQASLQGIELIDCMYEDVLDRIGSGDLVYLDPPYPPLNDTSYFQHYTIDKFLYQKQCELAENVKFLSDKGAFILMSNADTPLIRELYSSWNVIDIDAMRSINCKPKRTSVKELIISNY